jgi:hypothetical protein
MIAKVAKPTVETGEKVRLKLEAAVRGGPYNILAVGRLASPFAVYLRPHWRTLPRPHLFADIDPTKVQQPSYAGDSAGGTLTVKDGTHTANVVLLGNYMASMFVASSDGHGGTSVVDPPALGGVQPLVTPPHA